MKLRKCYVFSFGKLNDFSMEFSDELTCIKEDNGFGKTTLAHFIKSMFFGLSDTKKNLLENERKKYKPWNSIKKFGGYIIFSDSQNEYKLERYFGDKISEDEINLTDLSTGKSLEVDADFGRKIFNVDQDVFMSTLFLSDFDNKDASLFSSMGSENTFDSDKYQKAISVIDKKIKTLKSRGDKGIINDKKRDIFELNERVNLITKEVEQLDYVEKQILDVRNDIKQNKEEISKLNRKILNFREDSNDNSKNYNNNIAISVFNGQVPTKEQVDLIKGDFDSLKSLISRRKSLEEKFKTLEDPQNSSAGKEKKRLAIKLVLMIFASVLLIFGISFIFFDMLIGVLGLCASGIVLLFSCFISVRKNSGEINFDVFNNINMQIEDCKKSELYFENKIFLSLKKYNLPFNEGIISCLEKFLACYEEYINNTANVFNFDNNLLDASKQSSEFVNITKNITVLENKFEENNAILASLMIKRADLISKKEELFNLKAKQEIERGEYLKLCREYEVLENTIKYLRLANENLNMKYKKPLEESLNSYLKLLSQEEFELQLDTEYQLKIIEKTGAKDMAYYSEGYKNLFEICKRFAFIDVLFKDENPFVILDDPFINLDNKKIKKGIELISKLSKTRQIIYFTCNDSRMIR